MSHNALAKYELECGHVRRVRQEFDKYYCMSCDGWFKPIAKVTTWEYHRNRINL